jgi:Winged helix DNA-binding domain
MAQRPWSNFNSDMGDPPKLAWDQVLAWRMCRQFLKRPKSTATVAVVSRLCGVQAQVASSAELAVAARQPNPRKGDVAKNIASRNLIKTWAMRGTLHALPATEAAAYLSLLAASRFWEKGAWQRTFVTTKQIQRIGQAACSALDGTVLTREQLTEQIIDITKDKSIKEHLTSGWGAVLKPLAFQGFLINGPSEGNRVTFTRPDTYLKSWAGLPEPHAAAQTVIPAYLGAYGPASPETFDNWLMRGGSKRSTLKSWFADLVDAGTLVEVDIDGQAAYARADDVDNIAAAKPFDDVRLLPAFDQFVLGPGTKDVHIIAAKRRAQISKTAGWISPVVVWRSRVAGTWEAKDDALQVVCFKESGKPPKKQIEAEAARIEAYTGHKMTLRVTQQ